MGQPPQEIPPARLPARGRAPSSSRTPLSPSDTSDAFGGGSQGDEHSSVGTLEWPFRSLSCTGHHARQLEDAGLIVQVYREADEGTLTIRLLIADRRRSSPACGPSRHPNT
jgi:hypothetical protein